MKNRFYDNNGDFPEDLFGSNHGNDETDRDDYVEYINQDQISHNQKMDRRELNQKILFRTIRMLEKSWWWRFRSEDYKNQKIAETYSFFQSLIGLDEEFNDPDFDEN